jgi:glycosyltransferase involved in cell wall biosynthesis
MKLEVLYVYSDERGEYLGRELEHHLKRTRIVHVHTGKHELRFWLSLIICALEVTVTMIKKRVPPKIDANVLFSNLIRSPAFINILSSKVEKHIRTSTSKPSLILQWGGMFAPYVHNCKVPFAMIIDNYIDPPDSSSKKDGLRGWITCYDQSLYEFEKRLFPSAKIIFTLSRWCKEGLTREYGIESGKIFAIGWGPAKEVDTSVRTKKIKKTVLAVGTDYVAKGIDVLIETAKYLKDFSFTIVGKDDTFKGKKPENIHILGHIPEGEMIDLYRKSEIFFIFSRFDPSPHVLWEAQGYGCVVVGYDAFGISEVVINGRTGLLLKSRNPGFIAKQMQGLYQDKKIEEMSKAALENYLDNGTWTEVAQKITRALSTLGSVKQ